MNKPSRRALAVCFDPYQQPARGRLVVRVWQGFEVFGEAFATFGRVNRLEARGKGLRLARFGQRQDLVAS